MNARQLIALARGVAPDVPSKCQVCGDSPFRAKDSARKVLSADFTNYDLLLAPSAGEICTGCASLLGGRPSKDLANAPVRTVSFAVDGTFRVIDRVGMWAALYEVKPVRVLSWAQSRQKHHWLRAGLSHPGRYLIGADTVTIEYVPDRDRRLLEAVAEFCSGKVSRKMILSGDYSATTITRFGSQRWAELETVVGDYRGNQLLDLACGCAPKGEEAVGEKGDDVISDIDKQASLLLYLLTEGSQVRRDDGKMFWGGYLRHRVERFCRLPLGQFVSRMIDEMRCGPAMPTTVDAITILERLTPEQTAQVEDALRKRGGLLVALAYDQRKSYVAGRDSRKADIEVFAEAEASEQEKKQCELF